MCMNQILVVQPRGVKQRVRQNVTQQPVIHHKLLDVYRRQEGRKKERGGREGKGRKGKREREQKWFRAGTLVLEAVSLSFLSSSLVAWPWTSHLTSLGFSFLICEMGIDRPTSQGY